MPVMGAVNLPVDWSIPVPLRKAPLAGGWKQKKIGCFLSFSKVCAQNLFNWSTANCPKRRMLSQRISCAAPLTVAQLFCVGVWKFFRKRMVDLSWRSFHSWPCKTCETSIPEAIVTCSFKHSAALAHLNSLMELNPPSSSLVGPSQLGIVLPLQHAVTNSVYFCPLHTLFQVRDRVPFVCRPKKWCVELNKSISDQRASSSLMLCQCQLPARGWSSHNSPTMQAKRWLPNTRPFKHS